MSRIKSVFCISIFLLFSCTTKNSSVKEVNQMIKSIKKEFAPDKRVELFDIAVSEASNGLVLDGETTSKKAHEAFINKLENQQIAFEDHIRILPDAVVGEYSYAVGRNSVINIRSKPKHSAELGTQGLLGMNLRVLDKDGDFYRVQTPDQYISWVDKGGITRMTKSEFEAWNASKKVLFTKNFGYVYQEKNSNSTIVSDITLGGKLRYINEDENYYHVAYPDGRTGYLSKADAMLYDMWLNSVEASSDHIERTAKSMVGFPYLWGGTSSKGMDCSGFTKMVYLMNGFIIPRDASQQVNAGKIVDPNLVFEGLQKGDLLFFGKKGKDGKKPKVTHVGIWLGNDKGEFIHASGNVHLSSIEEDHPNYDEFNKNRYLGSRRYLGENDKLIVDLKEKIKM